MSYRGQDWEAEAKRLRQERGKLKAQLEDARHKLGVRRSNALRRAWRAFGRAVADSLPLLAALAIIALVAWVLRAEEAANDEKARALCERMCGESLVDVRRRFDDDVTCLCDDEDGLRAIEPWSVDE